MSEMGATDQQRILELCVFMAGFCARLAARRITETQIEQMEALLRSLDAGSGGRSKTLLDIDSAFQTLLRQAADNPYLTSKLESLCDLSPCNWPSLSDPIERDRAIVARLGRLLEALKHGDELAAESAVREHFLQSLEGISQTV